MVAVEGMPAASSGGKLFSPEPEGTIKARLVCMVFMCNEQLELWIGLRAEKGKCEIVLSQLQALFCNSIWRFLGWKYSIGDTSKFNVSFDE